MTFSLAKEVEKRSGSTLTSETSAMYKMAQEIDRVNKFPFIPNITIYSNRIRLLFRGQDDRIVCVVFKPRPEPSYIRKGLVFRPDSICNYVIPVNLKSCRTLPASGYA